MMLTYIAVVFALYIPRDYTSASGNRHSILYKGSIIPALLDSLINMLTVLYDLRVAPPLQECTVSFTNLVVLSFC